MLDVYHHLMQRVGGPDGRKLAEDLRRWHDAMVRHQRSLTALGFAVDSCAHHDECAHGEARDLWKRATQVLGDEVWDLTFLRTSAGVPSRRQVA